LTGGTQTNETIITSLLKPYEGVVAAETGHIAVHEAGAIENHGHKVLTIPSYEGKMKASDLNEYVATFYHDGNHEHMVFPGMVYISFSTEYGTLYTLEELKEISEICKQYKMHLFIDGARLGYGLMAKENDVDITDLSELCDVFTIGGTKVGALCGEAVVFTHDNAPEHFIPIIKQHGALLAKGRLTGIQFDALFTDGLYFKISAHAIHQANKLKKLLKDKGYQFYLDSPTNQQFVIVDNDKYATLLKDVRVSFMEKYDESHTVIRFCTSWATTDEQLLELEKLL
ncbi:MAG TPA: low specificity L-threonine aldolase, partial [Erysipelotrichaceae bacterium]|nr:low specificity L-threonine aldolase [Erysipelotrichaceae bacterium]